MSLWDSSTQLYEPDFVGLANYNTLLHNPKFWQSLKNTFLLVLGVVPAMATLPIAMALLVNGTLPGMAFFSIVTVPTSRHELGGGWDCLAMATRQSGAR